MSFTLDLSDEHVALRDTAHTFAREVIRPVAADYDRAQELPWPVLQEAARQGLYQWELYAQLSMDPSGLSLPILMEELFWGCAGIGLTIVLPALALAAIRQAATDEQLVEWAPQCFGTPDDIKLAALAVTEPSGGSDIRSIQTRARQEGSDWVIDGHKVFIGNGGIADVHVVVATVDPDAGHRGQGVFIVPKGTPGLSMLRKLDKLGCRASHTGEIVFEDSRPKKVAQRPPFSGAPRPPWERSSAPARWSPHRRSASLALRSSLPATTPSGARHSGSRSSRTRASPSPSPISPRTSTPPGC
jgi:acyl-CoA dehydrogenase